MKPRCGLVDPPNGLVDPPGGVVDSPGCSLALPRGFVGPRGGFVDTPGGFLTPRWRQPCASAASPTSPLGLGLPIRRIGRTHPADQHSDPDPVAPKGPIPRIESQSRIGRRIGSQIGLQTEREHRSRSGSGPLDQDNDEPTDWPGSEGPAKAQKLFWIMPFLWADTKTTNLENDFKAIMARIDEELKSKSLRAQIAHVRRHLESEPAHALMKHYPLSRKAKDQFDHQNALAMMRKKTKNRLWDTREIEKDGYEGFHMLDENTADKEWTITSMEEGTAIGVKNLDTPVTHLEMLQFWAYSMWLSEASRQVGTLNQKPVPPSVTLSQ